MIPAVICMEVFEEQKAGGCLADESDLGGDGAALVAAGFVHEILPPLLKWGGICHEPVCMDGDGGEW